MKKLILIVLVALLSGCQSMPPLNFSVPNVGYSNKKVEAELKSITVTLARPDERKAELPAGTEQVPGYWESALREALDRMVIFKDDAPKKLSLAVKILGFDAPSFGASMTTTSFARYELIDRSNGDIVYTQDISTAGEVPFSYALIGVVRLRESINRSVQNNISSFLQALETVDLSKPMFPAGIAKQ